MKKVKNNLKIKNFFIIILTILIFIINNESFSQCAMCKVVVESNIKNGMDYGKGLNSGILYLMSIPYIIVLLFVSYFYRNKIKKFIKNKI